MEENDKKKSATQIVKEIKRRTCGKFTAEEKIKIVLEGMRGEDTIAAICRKYAIHQNNYFKWLKEFIEAVKRRLSGDTLREATRDEVTDLGRMNDLLKRALGEMYVENKELKKTHDWLRVRRIIKLKKYMRLSQDEKIEIINLVENSDLSANRTLKELGLHKRTFYNWYKRYLDEGIDGLAPKAKCRQQMWNKIPPEQRSEVIEEALEHEELSPRELAFHIIDNHKWFISESSV